MKVKTKSGNPYHNAETGEFEEKDANSVATNDDEFEDTGFKDDDDIELDIDDDEDYDDPEYNIGDEIVDEDDIDDIDLDLDSEFDDLEVQENKAELNPEEMEYIDGLGFGQVEENLLTNNNYEFDKEKIFASSPEELKELLKAAVLIEKKKELIANNKELKDLNEPLFTNLWTEDVSADDWYKFKDGRWEKKVDYFLYQYNGADKQQKLSDLYKFKELGELYEESYNQLTSSFKGAEELIKKYEDPNSAYSQSRKDNAVWFKSNVVSKALEKFGPHADDVLNKLKKDNPQAWKAVYFYTGSYSVINEPLRGEKYTGYKSTPYGFVNTVKKMTEAIDASTYDFDYWVQRGTNRLKINDNLTIDYYTDEETLQKLVGKTFSHQSFYSAGAGKSTGYSSSSIILNTYCPRGTKGIYMNTQGQFAYGHENEMILQRGYQYKITKVEKHGSKTYIDVDVILGSDEQKYNDNQLSEIEKKYIKYYN